MLQQTSLKESSRPPETELVDPDLTVHTGTLIGPGTGLSVAGSIGGYDCNFTVDTGSDISIVHPDVVQDHKVDTLQPVTPCFKTVMGQKAPTKGRCNLIVKIGSTDISHPMWVAEIQDPYILGTDFLGPLGCVVNLKDSVLSIGDEEVPLQRIQSQPSSPPCYRAVLGETVTRDYESLVPVTIEGLILDPNEDCLHGIPGVMAGRTLVDLEQPTIPVHMLNFSEKQQRIKSGVTVAVCASVQSVLSKDAEKNRNFSHALPDHLKDLYNRLEVSMVWTQRDRCKSVSCFVTFPKYFLKVHKIWDEQTCASQPPCRLPLAK